MLCERPLEKKWANVHEIWTSVCTKLWKRVHRILVMQKTVSLRHEFVCLLIFITILRAHPLYELQVPPAITKYSPSGTTRLLPSLHVFVFSIQQVVLKLSTIIYAAKKRPYKRGVVITYISANHLTSRDTSRR